MGTGPVGSGAVYRPGLVRVASGGYVLFALWWIIDGAVKGRWEETARVSAPLALGAIVVHALFWRPEVRVDPEAVLLVNPLRRVRMPWARVDGIDTQYALTLIAGDHRYTSWAAAAPGRPLSWRSTDRGGSGDVDRMLADINPAEEGPTIRSSRSLHSDSGAAAFLVESYWSAWKESNTGVNAERSPDRNRSGPSGEQPGCLEGKADREPGRPNEEVLPRIETRWNVVFPATFTVALVLTLVSWTL